MKSSATSYFALSNKIFFKNLNPSNYIEVFGPAIAYRELFQLHRCFIFQQDVYKRQPTFRRVVAGETLRIGGRDFAVLTGAGHSPEHVMLHCAEANLILAADQIMAKISPNISVEAMDPEGDPLGLYLRSLAALTRELPGNVLVLPGHNLPFHGFGVRAAELAEHHRARCDAILAACREGPKTVAELVPVVFGRPIDDPHQFSFAFGEALAHVNLLVRRGALRFVEGADGFAAALV